MGVTDSSWTARPAPDEERRKELAREHCLRINDGDVDGLLKLYSPRIRFEDPVGSWTRTGLEALRAHATMAVGSNVRETAGLTVAGQDGRHAAVTVSATMDYLPSGPLLARHHLMTLPAPADPHRALIGIEYVMVIGVDADGLIDEMRAYWGQRTSPCSILPPSDTNGPRWCYVHLLFGSVHHCSSSRTTASFRMPFGNEREYRCRTHSRPRYARVFWCWRRQAC